MMTTTGNTDMNSTSPRGATISEETTGADPRADGQELSLQPELLETESMDIDPRSVGQELALDPREIETPYMMHEDVYPELYEVDPIPFAAKLEIEPDPRYKNKNQTMTYKAARFDQIIGMLKGVGLETNMDEWVPTDVSDHFEESGITAVVDQYAPIEMKRLTIGEGAPTVLIDSAALPLMEIIATCKKKLPVHVKFEDDDISCYIELDNTRTLEIKYDIKLNEFGAWYEGQSMTQPGLIQLIAELQKKRTVPRLAGRMAEWMKLPEEQLTESAVNAGCVCILSWLKVMTEDEMIEHSKACTAVQCLSIGMIEGMNEYDAECGCTPIINVKSLAYSPIVTTKGENTALAQLLPEDLYKIASPLIAIATYVMQMRSNTNPVHAAMYTAALMENAVIGKYLTTLSPTQRYSLLALFSLGGIAATEVNAYFAEGAADETEKEADALVKEVADMVYLTTDDTYTAEVANSYRSDPNKLSKMFMSLRTIGSIVGLMTGIFAIAKLVVLTYQDYRCKTQYNMSYFDYKEMTRTAAIPAWIAKAEKWLTDAVMDQTVQHCEDGLDIIKDGRALLRVVRSGGLTPTIMSLVTRIESETTAVAIRRKAYKQSTVPWTMWLTGASSACKSAVTPVIANRVYTEVSGEIVRADEIYTRNPNSERPDGLKAHHTHIVYDDIGLMTFQGAGSKSVAGEYCQIVNTGTVPMLAATLEEKGKLYAMPKVVTATSNFLLPKSLKVEMHATQPFQRRRRVLAYIELKEHYGKVDRTETDSSGWVMKYKPGAPEVNEDSYWYYILDPMQATLTADDKALVKSKRMSYQKFHAYCVKDMRKHLETSDIAAKLQARYENECDAKAEDVAERMLAQELSEVADEPPADAEAEAIAQACPWEHARDRLAHDLAKAFCDGSDLTTMRFFKASATEVNITQWQSEMPASSAEKLKNTLQVAKMLKLALVSFNAPAIHDVESKWWETDLAELVQLKRTMSQAEGRVPTDRHSFALWALSGAFAAKAYSPGRKLAWRAWLPGFNSGSKGYMLSGMDAIMPIMVTTVCTLGIGLMLRALYVNKTDTQAVKQMMNAQYDKNVNPAWKGKVSAKYQPNVELVDPQTNSFPFNESKHTMYESIVKKNVIMVSIRNMKTETHYARQNAMYVATGKVLVNKHFYDCLRKLKQDYPGNHFAIYDMDHNVELIVNPGTYQDSEHDVVLMDVTWAKGHKTFKDIRKHFVSVEDVNQTYHGNLTTCQRTPDGFTFYVVEAMSLNLKWNTSELVATDENSSVVFRLKNCMTYSFASSKGHCGMPVLIHDDTCDGSLYGVHALGRAGKCGATPVTCEWLNNAYEAQSAETIRASEYLKKDAVAVSVTPHPPTMTRTRILPNGKMQLIVDEVPKQRGRLMPWTDASGNKRVPLYDAVLDRFRPAVGKPDWVAKWEPLVKKHFSTKIHAASPPSCRFTIMEAVNGVKGKFDSMVLSKSAGPGLSGRVGDHMVMLMDGTFAPAEHVLTEVTRILGALPHCTEVQYAEVFGKDETLKDKIVVRETINGEAEEMKFDVPRQINNLSLAWRIVLRMLLGPYFDDIQQCDLGCKIGTDMLGVAMDDEVFALSEMLCGEYDVKGFDMSVSPWVIEMVFDLIIIPTMQAHTSWCEDDERMMKGLKYFFMHARLAIGTEVFEVFRVFLSGIGFTTKFGSLINSMVALMSIAESMSDGGVEKSLIERCLTQSHYVITYSDDAILVLKSELMPYAEMIIKHFPDNMGELGFMIKNPDEFKLQKGLVGLSFLSRDCIESTYGVGWALSWESLVNVLCWRKKNISEASHVADMTLPLQLEAARHGLEKFNLMKKWLDEGAKAIGMAVRTREYDEVMDSNRVRAGRSMAVEHVERIPWVMDVEMEASNTAVEGSEAAQVSPGVDGVTHVDNQGATFVEPDNVSQFERKESEQGLSAWMQRRSKVAEFAITPNGVATDISTTVQFPEALFSNTNLSGKLEYMLKMRADIIVEIVLPTSATHYGMLAAAPLYADNTIPTTIANAYYTGDSGWAAVFHLEPTLMTIGNQSTFTMKIPYKNIVRELFITRDAASYPTSRVCSLSFVEVIPFKQVDKTTDVLQDITVQVFARFDNFQMQIPTHIGIGEDAAPEMDSASKLVASAAAAGLGNIARNGVRAAVETAAGVAAGRSVVYSENTPLKVMQNVGGTLHMANRQDCSVPITLDNKAATSPAPLSQMDQGSFEAICNKEFPMNRVSWVTDEDTGSQLYRSYISPTSCINIGTEGVNNVVIPSPAMLTCLNFGLFAADAVVTVRVIAPMFANGALHVMIGGASNHNGTSTEPVGRLMKSETIVLSNNKAVTCDVPFVDARRMLNCGIPLATNNAIQLYKPRYYLGMVRLVVESPLIMPPSNDLTQDIQVLVTLSFKNVQLAMPVAKWPYLIPEGIKPVEGNLKHGVTRNAVAEETKLPMYRRMCALKDANPSQFRQVMEQLVITDADVEDAATDDGIVVLDAETEILYDVADTVTPVLNERIADSSAIEAEVIGGEHITSFNHLLMSLVPHSDAVNTQQSHVLMVPMVASPSTVNRHAQITSMFTYVHGDRIVAVESNEPAAKFVMLRTDKDGLFADESPFGELIDFHPTTIGDNMYLGKSKMTPLSTSIGGTTAQGTPHVVRVPWPYTEDWAYGLFNNSVGVPSPDYWVMAAGITVGTPPLTAAYPTVSFRHGYGDNVGVAQWRGLPQMVINTAQWNSISAGTPMFREAA